MNTAVVTIPKEFNKRSDLVAIPREEYEEFLEYKEDVARFELTKAQKKGLAQARKNLTNGKFLTLEQLKRKLGIKN